VVFLPNEKARSRFESFGRTNVSLTEKAAKRTTYPSPVKVLTVATDANALGSVWIDAKPRRSRNNHWDR